MEFRVQGEWKPLLCDLAFFPLLEWVLLICTPREGDWHPLEHVL